jgi:hypothetical protein
MERILINLDEDPSLPSFQIPPNINKLIISTVEDSYKSKKVKQESQQAKTAKQRSTLQAISELLKYGSVNRANLLAAGEAINISSLVIRIRNQLKKEGQYTLEKQGKGDNTIYYLAKMESDSDP